MSTEDLHVALRDNLSEMLIERGLSQRALSRMASLDETAVKQILSGRSRSPRLDTVARLADALDISVSILIGDRRSDAEHYGLMREILEILRRTGFIAIQADELDAVAAAMAASVVSGNGDTQPNADHVAAVAQNLVSLRRYRPSGNEERRRMSD
jgi:transcriptional regulator with XRE-family HTH domain